MNVGDYVYDDAHAKQFLPGTILFLEGDPIYLTTVLSSRTGIFGFHYIKLGDEPAAAQARVFKRGVDLQVKPVRLGLVNLKQARPGVVRLSRYAGRVFKIAPSVKNILVKECNPYRDMGHLPHLMFSQELLNTIQGNFPSIQEAMAITARQNGAVAFNRHYYLLSDGAIYYLYDPLPVGRVDKHEIVLKPNRKFLREHLSEVTGMPCC